MAVAASAQTPSAPAASEPTRAATTTVSGTTGIWFVPTAEVLPARKWSISFYRTNIDDGQGFADISTFPVTFAVGVADRVEIFGSWALDTRIDRDTRPLFFSPSDDSSGTGGGLLVDYPLLRDGWIGNRLGDAWVGGKVNLLASTDSPLALGVRGMVKLPIGDDGKGASSGKADFQVDGILSGYTPLAELSGYGGLMVRGNPEGYDLTNGLRWGVGAAFPQRYSLGFRFTAELFGEQYFDDEITAPAGLVGADGSMVPVSTRVESPVVASLGLTWQAPNGFFIGGAASWNMSMNSREDAGFDNTPKDDKGLQVRIGFHPGVRDRAAAARARAVAPPPAPTGPNAGQPGAPGAPGPNAAAPTAPATPNQPPTVRAACDPCTVEVGRTATVSADAQDPDGDALTYQWTTGAGTLAAPTARQSSWTAPMQVGPVAFTVTVSDGKGGTASDRTTIQVIRPAAAGPTAGPQGAAGPAGTAGPAGRAFTFEDVHFEFDRYTLRPDALRLLDQAVTAMQADPNLRLTIEGHTCNIGTAEYNLALGERRAQAVRAYLTAHGIAATRLSTVSYGEERPKYDNSREDTRRLNRRAALVVRME
jgi:peptidoglycan-associated lipoprotein